MISWESLLISFILGITSVLSVLGLESAFTSTSLDLWSKRFFIAFFTILVLCSGCFLFEIVIFAYPSLRTLEQADYYVYTILCAVLFPMLSTYLLHCSGEEWRGSLLFRSMAALWCVFFVLLNVAQFSSSFFYFAPDAHFHLGPFYPLLMAPVLAMLLLLTVGMCRRRTRLAKQYYRAFQVCLYPVTFALVIHMIEPSFPLLDIGMAISMFAMFSIIESAATEQALRQQREIARQRASIAVLEMRPHFIYNTMTSIYYLCDQDPAIAKQVTMDFISYLRRNFTAIAREETIPFAEELEHARAYLAVEQAQFVDDLVVGFDTPHTLFRLPPLTLQPIVENSVKHGMDPETVPLHIWVRTRKTETGSEIVVEDDGVGLKPGEEGVVLEADPGTSHVALANIRQRLEMMCGGRLDIRAREGGGTKVTLTIPEKE